VVSALVLLLSPKSLLPNSPSITGMRDSGAPSTEQQSGVSVGVAVVSKVLAAKFTQHYRHAWQWDALQEATAGAG
jgi:hypothetical protein